LPPGREPDWKAIDKQGPPPRSAKPEGDFTRMFGRSGGTASATGAPTPSGGASDTFQTPRSTAPASAAKAPPADDFSKAFGAPKPAAPSLKPPPSIAVAVEAPVKKPPVLILLVIIVALVVLAGCAFYYFVLRAK
jgi:hypothetical protein